MPLATCCASPSGTNQASQPPALAYARSSRQKFPAKFKFRCAGLTFKRWLDVLSCLPAAYYQ